jgi:hypothetical protein
MLDGMEHEESRANGGVDENIPLPIEEDEEAAAFVTVRVVDVQRSMGSHDTAWHPELAAGMDCPQCQRHKLKRHRSTVYCGFCRQRWWCKRPI